MQNRQNCIPVVPGKYKFLCEVKNSLLLKLTFFDMWKIKAQAIDTVHTLKEGM